MASPIVSEISSEISSEPSLCIKYARTQLNRENISWQFITSVIEAALRASPDDEPCNGCVKRVDRVFKTDEGTGHPYMTVFIHMNFWPDNENAQRFKKSIMKGNEKKIYYHQKWFWKIVKSNKLAPEPTKFVPFIDNKDDDSD
tara:strand:+ start:88 stop:516 length:429 start_codon:yes stop_codon:yes gene_type:complete